MVMKGCDKSAHNRCVGYNECEYCRINRFCGEIGYCADDCEFCKYYNTCDRPEREEI